MATVTTSRTRGQVVTAAARGAPFRRMLEKQRAECVGQRGLALVDTVGSLPDPVAMACSAQLLRTVEEMDAALARLDACTFGRCVSCGSAIPVERLEFRPFAAACITCLQRVA